MKQRCVDDWCTLSGVNVEIRQQGSVVSSGTVEAVTEDGKILWLHSPVEGRRLFEKAEFYQAWAVEERASTTGCLEANGPFSIQIEATPGPLTQDATTKVRCMSSRNVHSPLGRFNAGSAMLSCTCSMGNDPLAGARTTN